MADNKEKLFTQFPPVSYDTWRAKVDADLKGVPFEKKLVWRTNEGFNVQPMYRRDDIADLKTTDSLPGEFPYIRGTRDNNNWLTRQDILAADPAEANKAALDVLQKGVNSLGFKVKEPSSETIATLLKGIDLKAVEVNFDTEYKLYKNLSLFVELGYIRLDLDKDLWKGVGYEAKENNFKGTFSVGYKF